MSGYTIKVTPERAAELILAVGRLTEERDCETLRADTMMENIKTQQRHIDAATIRAERAETALRAIIARADNNEPGTSKVQDMRYIAQTALKK